MSYIDDRIIEMRKKRAFIITIKKWVAKQCPIIDSQVCLSRVLTNLDSQKLPYSRSEVLTAFNYDYDRDFHGEKKAYLNWLCKNRTHPRKKDPMEHTTDIKEPQTAIKSTKQGDC